MLRFTIMLHVIIIRTLSVNQYTMSNTTHFAAVNVSNINV